MLARSTTAAPKSILSLALLLMAVAGVIGAPAAQKLSTGGFADPDADSTKVSELLADKFHIGGEQIFLIVRANEPIDSPAPRKFVEQLIGQLRAVDYVSTVKSPWDSPNPVDAGSISRDKSAALVAVDLTGGETRSASQAAELTRRFAGNHDGGITVLAGGTGVADAEISAQARRDLSLSEAIALPISFVVLVWVFGGVIAAMIPLTVGGFAILGSTAIIRLLAEVTQVSAFALNVSAVMGLALAIDYSLLIVSRYREDIAGGADPEEAIRRTVHTAGRTVMFSAITVGLCLSAMALFPMYALRSLAYGGVAVVLLAGLASLVVTPAIIRLTGKRITNGRTPRHGSRNVWDRWARAVMRRPIVTIVVTTIPLFLIASPFLNARLGLPDERILPSTSQAPRFAHEVHTNFNRDLTPTVQVVIPDSRHLNGVQIRSYASELSRVPDVVAVVSPEKTFVRGAAVSPGSGQSGARDGSVLLAVSTRTALFSDESRIVLKHLRAVPRPANTTVWFGGMEQSNRDSIDSIASRLPVVLGSIAVVMFALLFMLTGSVTIPVKALVLNTLSLSATFGAMVWVFQEGHLGGLGTTAGPLLAIIPILLFCVAFGLSMDYEVFLISRMREFWLDSEKTRGANDDAVARGIATTGRVVTAAALIMTISFAALIASQVSLIRIFGLGLTLAIFLDATVIRMALLPAAMTLLGRWNWWAPSLPRRLSPANTSTQHVDGPSAASGQEATTPPAERGAKKLGWAAMTRGALVTRLEHHRGWHKQLASFDIAYFRSGTRRFVSLAHPDHIDYVLHEGRLNYRKSIDNEPLRAMAGVSLLTDEGQSWGWHRSVINPGLVKRRLNDLVESMTGPVSDLASKIDRSLDGATDVDMTDAMVNLALDITGKVVFTSNFEPITRALFDMVVNNPLGDKVTRILSLAETPIWFFRAVIWLVKSALPLPWPFRTIQATVHSLDQTPWDLIRERRLNPSDGPDLLNYLLQAEDESGIRLSDQRVHDESLTFVVAGYETTGNGLQWMWYLLALHPQAREKLLSEVDRVLGGRKPTAADLPQLRWTSACFMEALRYYGPSWVMWRRAVRPDNIGGYRIRRGTTVLMAAHAVHHDPRWWDDPETFDPSRFMPAATKDRPRGAFVPFGAGKRICIGQNLAVMEAVLTTAMLSQRFVFDAKPGHPVEPVTAMALRPRHRLTMVVRRR